MTCHDKGATPPCLLPMITRRRFLAQSAGVAAATAVLPACEFAESFATGEGFDFDLAMEPFASLTEVGSSASYDAGGLQVLLVRVDADNVFAFDRICPHAGLDMGFEVQTLTNTPNAWLPDTKQLRCGHHFSFYEESGEKASGPTPSGINRYEVTFDAAAGTGRFEPNIV